MTLKYAVEISDFAEQTTQNSS